MTTTRTYTNTSVPYYYVKAGDAFDTVVDQLEECGEDFTEAKNKSKQAMKTFEETKRKRSQRFNAAFQHIAEALTTIYKDMTKSR